MDGLFSPEIISTSNEHILRSNFLFMPKSISTLENNFLYRILTNENGFHVDSVNQVNCLLHEQHEIAELTDPSEGSLFHVVCRNSKNQKLASRLLYSLSNAGGDPNVVDGKGNTPLHEIARRNPKEIDEDLLEALFRIGVDPRIKNLEEKTAVNYLNEDSPSISIFQSYSHGIWAAVESKNIRETLRLIEGFIKIDCKHNSNKTLLDKAVDLDCREIIEIFSEHQATNEFLHSILAFDWKRAELIYRTKEKSLKLNGNDSTHRFTRRENVIRTFSKSIFEFCLETKSLASWQIFPTRALEKIDVNVLCGDGLPLFFHCFDPNLSESARRYFLINANIHRKSSQGQTFLFHLIKLFQAENQERYLHLFKTIIYLYPMAVCQRDRSNRTVVETILLSDPETYEKIRCFEEILRKNFIRFLNNETVIEHLFVKDFSHRLWILVRNQYLNMNDRVFKLLSSIKSRNQIFFSIDEFRNCLMKNDVQRLKTILDRKPILHSIRDAYGRTGVHLAVLHKNHQVLQLLIEDFPTLLSSRDTLDRTAFHYACILKDTASIEILGKFLIFQHPDAFNIKAKEYLDRRELCCEQFDSKNLKKLAENAEQTSISDILKLAFYLDLKEAIENDQIEKIRSINNKIVSMGFQLDQFEKNSDLNDFCYGQRYIPLWFIAVNRQSNLSIEFFEQIQLRKIGRFCVNRSNLVQLDPSKFPLAQEEQFRWFDLSEFFDEPKIIYQDFSSSSSSDIEETVPQPSSPTPKKPIRIFNIAELKLRKFFRRTRPNPQV